MRIEPEVSQVAVVLLGHFNPAIFQPWWMARHGLISDAAAESAQIGVVHPDITAFVIEGQFSFEVQRERLAITRTVSPYILVADVISKMFGDLLPHTPVARMGINFMVHFDAGSLAKRDEIGQMLAPPAPWGEWGKLVSSGEGKMHGGMQSLSMIQRNLDDRPAGHILAKIEPSSRIKGRMSGIYMEINDHYEVPEEQAQDARAIVTILQERFDRSLANSRKIVDQIMSLVK